MQEIFMIITDEQEYRSHPALNFSSAKHLLKSQKQFVAAKKEPFKPSRDMIIGTMVHSLALESKNGDYVVKPEDMDFRSTEGKKWKTAQKDREILSQEEHQTVLRTSKALHDDPDASYLLSKCLQREIGIVVEYRGVQIKARLDAIGKDEVEMPLLLDLKTTSDANPPDWSRKACSLSYLAQMEWYKNVYSLFHKLESPPSWAWIVAETSLAAEVVIIRPTEEAVEIGRAQMDLMIDRYADLQKTGKAKGYPSGMLDIEIPIYEKRRWIK